YSLKQQSKSLQRLYFLALQRFYFLKLSKTGLYTTPQKKQKYFYGSDAINSVSLYTEYQNRKTEK
ncbi:MAG: hypothetical protein KHY91_03325, partial [Roseburia sp.]|nr:hypothetical protein [Roseburia sp.]